MRHIIAVQSVPVPRLCALNLGATAGLTENWGAVAYLILPQPYTPG